MDLELDDYLNLYRYRKNKRRRFRGKRNRTKYILRYRGYKRTFSKRFERSVLRQQAMQQLTNISLTLANWFCSLRDPIRRLKQLRPSFIKEMKRTVSFLVKQKHFKNTCYIVIFLHYYKAIELFSQHFGREIQKVRKQIH